MSIHVTDFNWEKGKNDLKYIELLEKTLKNEQAITANAVAKIRKLSAENKEIRAKAIDEFAKRLHELCGVEIEDYQYTDLLHENRIDEIAEQMKGGAE